MREGLAPKAVSNLVIDLDVILKQRCAGGSCARKHADALADAFSSWCVLTTFSRDFTALWAGVTPDQAREAIRWLRDHGFIVKAGQHGRAYTYLVGSGR